MNKFLPFATAALLAAGISFAAATPSVAGPHDDAAAAAFAGGELGFMAGTMAAQGAPPPHRMHHRDWAWEQHVQDCEDYWGWRYDPETDLVTRRGHQFPCQLD
jgi:hypothetical protein